jgi:hypothetical protein
MDVLALLIPKLQALERHILCLLLVVCRRASVTQGGVQPRNVIDNADGSLVDPAGYPLPPCIVMERGESLDLWSQRAKPDRSQAYSVRACTALHPSSLLYC